MAALERQRNLKRTFRRLGLFAAIVLFAIPLGACGPKDDKVYPNPGVCVSPSSKSVNVEQPGEPTKVIVFQYCPSPSPS